MRPAWDAKESSIARTDGATGRCSRFDTGRRDRAPHPAPLSDVSSETQQGSINKSITRQLIIFLQAARPAPGKLPSQQVLKLQQACYMALRVCVPVYDTVTQGFRVCCCNDSEAGRMIWTRPAQIAGQAVQAV